MDEAIPVAGQTLHLIKARFPACAAQVVHAYQHDESFRGLCEDYRECLTVVERLRVDLADGAEARRNEYTELLEELACEIREWLQAHPET